MKNIDSIDLINTEHRGVVIIGSGPAGLTAAIYTARANLAPLVIQGAPGGQLNTAMIVENYPGFADGIAGPELIQNIERQAVRMGAELRNGSLTEVDFDQRPFRLTLDGDKTVLADAVIVATGATAKYLGLENEQRLIGRGVSACATCDGAFYRDRDIAVIGGGDVAIEEALFLTRFASKVYVIHRRDGLRATKLVQERAFANNKIAFVWNTVVTDILGDDEVEGLQLKNMMTGKTSTLPVSGMFVAIGHQPDTEIFQGWLKMDERGYILAYPDSTQTNLPGVFVCGDVQAKAYRQAITAAGTGCMAAVEAERWLAEHEFSESARERSPQDFLSNSLMGKEKESKELAKNFLKT
ncbi:MAG: thioredoxin-disulfide reductase [Waterburya sp.]